MKNKEKTRNFIEYLKYSTNKYGAFTALQAREVFAKEKDAKETKDKVIAIAVPIVKFIAVAAIAFLICFLLRMFNVLNASSMFSLLTFFVSIMFVLQLLTCTSSCTKNYYVAEDNKVLITFPSTGVTLFLSKLTIEFLKELKSMCNFFLPVVFGIILYSVFMNPLAPYSFFVVIWSIIPMVLLVAIIVLLGSLLSVIYLQYLRLIKMAPWVRFVLIFGLFAAIVVLVLFLVNKIPAEINLIQTWNTIRDNIDEFIVAFAGYAVPISWLLGAAVGIQSAKFEPYVLTGVSFLRTLALIGVVIVLFVIVFFAIKKLFLAMMAKSVDFEKVNEDADRDNHVHHRHTTFLFKELKISFRTFEISATYIITYILIPVLIFILCKIFAAFDTSMKGDMLSIMFSMLLIVLPLLASNTPLSSSYSREGYAGYIKKTKPIGPLTPMISKLAFNLALSIPCIFASMTFVKIFCKIDTASVILLGFSVLFIQYAHIFFSSTLDFINPKNENYQIEGQNAKNSNENISTAVAFIMAAAFALLIYLFFMENVNQFVTTFEIASLRLFFISFLVFGSCLTLYLLKLKAFFLRK